MRAPANQANLAAFQSVTSGKAGGVHGEPLKAVSAPRACVCAVALSLENL
jgi:hypothetical protein